jgi:hypothetical protein
MLGTTLWLVTALGLLAALLLDGAAAFGRAGFHAAADHALEAALDDAVADYQNRLQAELAHAAATGAAVHYEIAVAALPNPLRGAYGATQDPGARVDYDVTPTTIAAPDCAPSGAASSGPDAIGWMQCNGFVSESRMSLRVFARVVDASGAAVAQREQYVTLRLFGEAPYSAIAGRKDAGAADPAGAGALAPPAHEGDAAGATVSGTLSLPPAAGRPAGGTLIHVRYECRDGAGSCANAMPPDPDDALRAGARWENGNRPVP